MNLPLLLAETTRSELRWDALPPAWVLVMLLVPTVSLLAWWGYARERDVPVRARLLLASLRGLALFFFLLLVFGPYMELSELRTVRSHLIVLVDTSDSMSTEDGYEPADADALADASGLPSSEVPTRSRLDLARAVLENRESGLLEGWTEKFRVHLMSFGSQLTPIESTGETTEGEKTEETRTPADRLREGLGRLRAREPSTRIGQSVSTVLDTFRLRDEPVAGIIVISDGQDNAGSPGPLQAGRRALAQDVPVFSVGVGDPRSPRNVHVANLRAKEVVLARDTALFEFTVRAKGFEGRPARVEMQRLDDDGQPTGSTLAIDPGQIVLDGGDNEQQVKVTHNFRIAGTYSVRLGVPPQPEEKIHIDNWVTHTIRVIDRKIKVLYVEGPPRYEYIFLSNALTRDRDTMLVHTLLLDADPDTPQKSSRTRGWRPLDMSRGLPKREDLFEYDVVILGDIDWRDLADSPGRAKQALENVHEFVEKGGGLIMLSGPRHNPSRYRDTDLEPLLPVVIDRTTESLDPQVDQGRGWPLRLTAEGRRSPLMDVAGNPDRSRALWENTDRWRQYWAYPALRAKTLAKVLAVADEPRYENKFGPRPAIASMIYGRGRVLFVGVEELWRMRWQVGDQYFYRFYGEAVRFLATYKLLGGNERFKIMTDRESYSLDDPVRITLHVLDRDYDPATDDVQEIELDMPGPEPGSRETTMLPIQKDESEPGTYRRSLVPTRPGQYRLSRAPDVVGDEPAKKIFAVVQSSLEGRDLLLDEVTLRAVADSSSGGRTMPLWDLPDLSPPPRNKPVPTDVRPEELWDNGWALLVALLLLGAEWLLRKRWQLV